MRHPDDHASIGIILCKAKNHVVAEYALRDIEKPLAISTYLTRLIESLPERLANELSPPKSKKKKKKPIARTRTSSQKAILAKPVDEPCAARLSSGEWIYPACSDHHSASTASHYAPSGARRIA